MKDFNFRKQKITIRILLLMVLSALAAFFYCNQKEFIMGDMQLNQLIFMTNMICTYIMVGIIWVVQIVNYNLFNQIGREAFAGYHKKHVWLITLVVGPPMLLEALSSVLMLWYPFAPLEFIWKGIVLIFIIWLSTLFLLVPQHDVLSKGFSDKAYKRINMFNWIRTICWTLRAVLVTVMLNGLIKA